MSLAADMLTARAAEGECAAGLDSGADDLLSKRFSAPALPARMRAVPRRRAPEARHAVVEAHRLRVGPATHRVTRRIDGEGRDACVAEMSPTELRLLHIPMRHPEPAHSAVLIETARGARYRLTLQPGNASG